MAVSKAKKSKVRVARESAYRTLVLEAAERVFGNKGFEGAKIKDVADEAGLALGTVYSIYPSKRDVFVAVHEHRGIPLMTRLLAAIGAQPTPFDALTEGLAAACAYYAEFPSYLRMHLHSGTSWADPRLDVREEQRVFDQGRAPLVALFETARTRGELIDESPDTCARMCLAMLQVLFSEWEREKFRTSAAEVAVRASRLALGTFRAH